MEKYVHGGRACPRLATEESGAAIGWETLEGGSTATGPLRARGVADRASGGDYETLSVRCRHVCTQAREDGGVRGVNQLRSCRQPTSTKVLWGIFYLIHKKS